MCFLIEKKIDSEVALHTDPLTSNTFIFNIGGWINLFYTSTVVKDLVYKIHKNSSLRIKYNSRNQN